MKRLGTEKIIYCSVELSADAILYLADGVRLHSYSGDVSWSRSAQLELILLVI